MYRLVMIAVALSLFASAAVSGGDGAGDAGERKVAANEKTSFHGFTVKSNDGSDVELSKYKGEVCLVVNVASK